MTIKRGILGERTGSIFGTIEIVLSENELKAAYEEYLLILKESTHGDDSEKQRRTSP